MECCWSLTLALLCRLASAATPEKLHHPILLLLGHHCQQLSESAGSVLTVNLLVITNSQPPCDNILESQVAD